MSKRTQTPPTLIEKIDVIPTAAVLAAVLTWFLHRVFATGGSLPTYPLWMLIAAFIVIGIGITHSKQLSKKAKQASLSFLTHFGAWLPIMAVFWQVYFWDHLNGRWAQESTFFAGKMAITLLFLSLAVTPLMTVFGWKELNPLKKPLGNYGFILVCIHLLIFTYDYSFLEGNWELGLALSEAINKQYALVGLITFLILIPLAATSNKTSIKRLKRNWKKLHQLVYLINVLAVAHYIWVWSAKRAFTEPFIFTAILIVLLLLRVKPIKQRIIRARQGFVKRRRAAAA